MHRCILLSVQMFQQPIGKKLVRRPWLRSNVTNISESPVHVPLGPYLTDFSHCFTWDPPSSHFIWRKSQGIGCDLTKPILMVAHLPCRVHVPNLWGKLSIEASDLPQRKYLCLHPTAVVSNTLLPWRSWKSRQCLRKTALRLDDSKAHQYPLCKMQNGENGTCLPTDFMKGGWCGKVETPLKKPEAAIPVARILLRNTSLR